MCEFSKLATVRNLILSLELRHTPPKEIIIQIINSDIHSSHHTAQPKMDDLQFLKLAITPKELNFFIERVTQLNSATPATLCPTRNYQMNSLRLCLKREFQNKKRNEVSELQRNRPSFNPSNQTNNYNSRPSNFSERNQQNRNHFQSEFY